MPDSIRYAVIYGPVMNGERGALSRAPSPLITPGNTAQTLIR